MSSPAQLGDEAVEVGPGVVATMSSNVSSLVFYRDLVGLELPSDREVRDTASSSR